MSDQETKKEKARKKLITVHSTQCSKIRKKVQFQKCKKTFFAISEMAKNQFLNWGKV